MFLISVFICSIKILLTETSLASAIIPVTSIVLIHILIHISQWERMIFWWSKNYLRAYGPFLLFLEKIKTKTKIKLFTQILEHIHFSQELVNCDSTNNWSGNNYFLMKTLLPDWLTFILASREVPKYYHFWKIVHFHQELFNCVGFYTKTDTFKFSFFQTL